MINASKYEIYLFERKKFGVEKYTIGNETATLKAHVNSENKVYFILSPSDLGIGWWKAIIGEVLSPRDIIIEKHSCPVKPIVKKQKRLS